MDLLYLMDSLGAYEGYPVESGIKNESYIDSRKEEELVSCDRDLSSYLKFLARDTNRCVFSIFLPDIPIVPIRKRGNGSLTDTPPTDPVANSLGPPPMVSGCVWSPVDK